MSTPSHVVMSVLLAMLFTDSIIILCWAGIFGAVPDLVRFVQEDYNDWTKYYRKIHQPYFYKDVIIDKYVSKGGVSTTTQKKGYLDTKWAMLWLIPPIGLHCAIDLLCHKKEGGWNWVGWVFEIASWIIYFVIFQMLILNHSMRL